MFSTTENKLKELLGSSLTWDERLAAMLAATWWSFTPLGIAGSVKTPAMEQCGRTPTYPGVFFPACELGWSTIQPINLDHRNGHSNLKNAFWNTISWFSARGEPTASSWNLANRQDLWVCSEIGDLGTSICGETPGRSSWSGKSEKSQGFFFVKKENYK